MPPSTLAELDLFRFQTLTRALGVAALAERFDGVVVGRVLRWFSRGKRTDFAATFPVVDAWLSLLAPEGLAEEGELDPLATGGVDFVLGAVLGALVLAHGGPGLRAPRGFRPALRRLSRMEGADEALCHAIQPELRRAALDTFHCLCAASPSLRRQLAQTRLAAAALRDDDEDEDAPTWPRALFVAGFIAAGVAAPERRSRRMHVASKF